MTESTSSEYFTRCDTNKATTESIGVQTVSRKAQRDTTLLSPSSPMMVQSVARAIALAKADLAESKRRFSATGSTRFRGRSRSRNTCRRSTKATNKKNSNKRNNKSNRSDIPTGDMVLVLNKVEEAEHTPTCTVDEEVRDHVQQRHDRKRTCRRRCKNGKTRMVKGTENLRSLNQIFGTKEVESWKTSHVRDRITAILSNPIPYRDCPSGHGPKNPTQILHRNTYDARAYVANQRQMQPITNGERVFNKYIDSSNSIREWDGIDGYQSSQWRDQIDTLLESTIQKSDDGSVAEKGQWRIAQDYDYKPYNQTRPVTSQDYNPQLVNHTAVVQGDAFNTKSANDHVVWIGHQIAETMNTLRHSVERNFQDNEISKLRRHSPTRDPLYAVNDETQRLKEELLRLGESSTGTTAGTYRKQVIPEQKRPDRKQANVPSFYEQQTGQSVAASKVSDNTRHEPMFENKSKISKSVKRDRSFLANNKIEARITANQSEMESLRQQIGDTELKKVKAELEESKPRIERKQSRMDWFRDLENTRKMSRRASTGGINFQSVKDEMKKY